GLPGLAARCGVRAHARCALAPWRSRATGLTAALCLGAGRLAGWRLKGGGCGGTLGLCRILPPLVIVRVLGDPGLLGCCALVLPGGRGAGRGFADLTARGNMAMRGLAVFACAVADIAGGETQTLEYRKEAW
ncbi:MAG: hypothetical protein RDU30_06675, partial [Desulfovibrionaceae bacterium]|nr:hypothetical protein [Desulfovibrionaceae bacterium]